MDLSVEPGVFDNVDVRLMQAGEQYVAELVLPNGATYADVLPAPDCEALGSIEDPREYGRALFDWLFPGGDVAFASGAPRSLRAGLEQALRESHLQERSLPTGGKMRLRLTLDPASRVLHKLWWETMYSPDVGELALRMAVARLVSTGLGRLWPVSEPKLRLLVVTSNPAGLDQYGCQPVDESFEKMLLGKALGRAWERMEVQRLPMAGIGGLAERIRSSPAPHIVYLLAHTIYDENGEGQMLLSNPEGYAEAVPFSEIARVLAPVDGPPPRLVFLALPLTAQVDYDNTLAALGPAIVSSGVQSVVAVHAPFPEDMLIDFSEVFFQNLVMEGQAIEKATMLARGAIFSPGHWGWAYPVLYLGTPDGTLFQPLRQEVEEHFRSVAQRLKA
jgi:hypothetical protein